MALYFTLLSEEKPQVSWSRADGVKTCLFSSSLLRSHPIQSRHRSSLDVSTALRMRYVFLCHDFHFVPSASCIMTYHSRTKVPPYSTTFLILLPSIPRISSKE
ncbi:hypothetical protein C8Q75DRAFT_570488 [Abortiporus biennis]|nr:hypothetical protein C8Q75DRAFT_570488 [Abortiporus biennis]